ncbi:hypothetical protein TPHA_0K01570 [Tetrapisispora phaffii CBS 4417]|uniref:Uncharacterized protein n=1 Tax=Tetrapisispora phaffii (strain ATCC 24235 / CBS 4417 / NBRC 1672 / NRRL Y-8282 / UCD 70-5) TaxID=1071381 RepID=G8BZG2_TETPH|nr:hypothetical protein TPHA_0K01570 [Tetrapisispora phaffii CBS 4417]CCE65290.1 hypothetical protein TPHA_0K01570 [Tetrapisispora phaffii CBS 4417]
MQEISVAHIQHDFKECITDVEEGKLREDGFFINVDLSAEHIQEYHVDIKAGKDPEVRMVSDANANDRATLENYSFKKIKSNLFEAELEGDSKYMFETMKEDLTRSEKITMEETNWTSIDSISIPNKKYCLGDSQGNIHILTENFDLMRTIKSAHLGEVTVSSFFPSGEVILSASTDLRIKLWSVNDGLNLRTLVGHTAKISATAMIDRGRNIISGSKDGSLRLWECGSGKNIKTFSRKENTKDGINDIHLLANCNENGATNATEENNELEFGTRGKQIIAAHESGVITMHQIYNKNQILQLPSRYMSACNSLTATDLNDNYIYGGYDNGIIAQWDIRQAGKCVNEWAINEGCPINEMFYDNSHMYVSSGNDTSLKFSMNKHNGEFDHEIPTFLCSDDYGVANYCRSLRNESGVVAVGNRGFIGHYY